MNIPPMARAVPAYIEALTDDELLEALSKPKRKRLPGFHDYLDARIWTLAPTVARLIDSKTGTFRYIIVGTVYGHVYTSGGDIRTWASYSGARRFLNSYEAF